jgi:hypothetical protein
VNNWITYETVNLYCFTTTAFSRMSIKNKLAWKLKNIPLHQTIPSWCCKCIYWICCSPSNFKVKIIN